MDVQAIKRKRYVYLFASAISILVLGLVYGGSLFATPLAEIYGWEMSAVKMTFTFCMMAFCVGGLIGVKVLKTLGLRGAILLAACLLVCGFGGTALLAPQGIWALWICYGVLIGCGTGLGYNVTIASITPWFPDKSGFASGVMFAGFGLGSITLGTLTRGIIGTAGITVAFAVVAVTAGVVMVLLSLLLKRAPENIADILGVTAKKTKTAPDAEADQRHLFKDPAFYTYYLWAIIILGAGLTMIGTSMQGAVELGVAETFAATLTGIIPIVNGFSGFSMGVVYDKLGLRKCMILVGRHRVCGPRDARDVLPNGCQRGVHRRLPGAGRSIRQRGAACRRVRPRALRQRTLSAPPGHRQHRHRRRLRLPAGRVERMRRCQPRRLHRADRLRRRRVADEHHPLPHHQAEEGVGEPPRLGATPRRFGALVEGRGPSVLAESLPSHKRLQGWEAFP